MLDVEGTSEKMIEGQSKTDDAKLTLDAADRLGVEETLSSKHSSPSLAPP